MIFLVIPLTFAATEYNRTGTTNQDYRVGTGIFNDQLTTSLIQIRSLIDSQSIPMVADLDGDGDNEIIVIDDSTVRLFRSESLDVVDSLILESGFYSNPVLTDIDKDGKIEIIIANTASGNGNISIIEYNGTDLFRQSTVIVGLETISSGQHEIMIECNDGQSNTESITCLYAVATTTTGDNNMSVFAFNESNISARTILFSSTVGSEQYCFPLIPSIAYTDFDSPAGDSRKEFIFTFGEFILTGNDDINVIALDLGEDLSITTDLIFDITNLNPVDAGTCSSSNMGRHFTSPYVADLNGASSDGKEIVVGFNLDGLEFVMNVHRSNGDVLDTHPLFFVAEGQLISNVMKANIFGDTGEVEYCIAGHNSQDQTLDLLCGSQLTGNIVDTLEFKFSTEGRFNITVLDYREQTMISHMGSHSNTLVDISGEGLLNPTELVNTYGTFQITDDTFPSAVLVKTIDLLFENPSGESACIQVDEQKRGSEDLICITDTSLIYIDDTLTNQPALITEVNINPCIDAVVKINTTMQVLVTVTDQNPSPLVQDLVSSVVSIYDTTVDEQNSTLSNFSSGQIMPHNFIINVSGTNNLMTIQGFDSENPDDIDIITQSFTVGSNGVEFGDCETTLIITVDDDNVTGLNISTAARANEGLTDFFEGTSNEFKVTGLVIALFLMLGWTIAVLTTKDGVNDSMITMNKVVFMLVGNVFIFIIAVVAGAISFGVLLTLIIFGVFAIGIWVRRMFTANNM